MVEVLKRLSVKDIITVGMFTALMAVLSQVSIPLPVSPVPLTLSLFVVYLSASILGLKLGLFVQAAYLLLGVVGIPVFSGLKGGFAHLFGPTGGYLLSYFVMTAMIGAFSDHISATRLCRPSKDERPITLMIAYAAVYLASLSICYLLGSLWLSKVLDIPIVQGFIFGALPYIPLDIIKIAACALVVVPVRRRYLSVTTVSRPDV